MLSVVVPCYRSAPVLRGLVDRIATAGDAMVESGTLLDWEIVLVVDGSPDDTAAVARGIAHDEARVTVAELHRNYGQHNALLAGIRLARYDVIVTMDDDHQHPPEEIGKLLAVLAEPDVDLVYGVAVVEEHNVLRSAASRFVKAALAATGVVNAQWVSAFRAFRTTLRDAFAEASDPSPNVDVLLSWATASVRSAPVEMEKRATGRSGYTFTKLMRHAMNMITGYGTLPLRLATWFGFVFGLLGFLTLVYVLVAYLAGITTVEGFTTTVGLIALFSGVQLVTIGIIGEYIGRAHFRSMNKPTYFIRSVTRSGE